MKEKIPRRTSKLLPKTLYIYVEEKNAEHAKFEGKKLFGSYSAYVNALIAKDRGAKPILGYWKAKGEAKKVYVRTRNEKKNARRAVVRVQKKTHKENVKREIA